MGQCWAIDSQTSGVGVDSGTGGEWSGNISSSSASITAITNAANAQVTTSTAHGFSVGDHVFFYSVGGMTTINSSQSTYETGTLKFVASVIDDYNFTIDWNSSSAAAYTSGGTVTMAGVTRSNPCRIRIPNHSFAVGDRVYIASVGGATQVNAITWLVSAATTNSFTIATPSTGVDYNAASIGVYTSGGTAKAYRRKATAITQANPAVFTVKAHAFTNGQKVFVDATDVSGMTELTSQLCTVANATTDTFELTEINSSAYSAYTNNVFVRRPTASFEYLRLLGDDLVSTGSYIRIAASTAATQRTAANCTWTFDSNTVSTSASLVGTIAVGDLVGRESTGGNGKVERFYEVTAINSSTITLRDKYYGTTGTDTASVYHLPNASIAIYGVSGASGINNTKNFIVSGGWNTTMTSQTGETWIKHGVNDSGSNHFGVVNYAGSIDKINIYKYYYSINQLGSGGTITNCSMMSSTVYCFNTTNGLSGLTFTNLMIGASINQSYVTWVYYSPATTSGVVVWGWGGLAGYAVTFYSNTNYDLSGVKVVCAYSGLYLAVANVDVNGGIIDSCYISVQVTAAGSNCYIHNQTILNPRASGFGVYFNSLCYAGTVENIDFPSVNTGIQLVQSTGIVVRQCSFSSSTYNFRLDQYSSDLLIEDTDFGNPVTYGILADSATCKNIKIRGCIIDSGAESKFGNIGASESYGVPTYIIDDSFGIDGVRYYNGLSLFSNTTEAEGSQPCLAINFASVVTRNFLPVRIVSAWVNAGVGKKFKLRMKRSATAFSGSLIPVFFLNGIEKNTETTITSLNTTYTDYEFDCDSSEIDADGMLELRFIMNSTVNSIYIDGFEVEALP